MLEILEDRIAPATLLNPTTLVYTDIDGDTVTVKVSKGDLAGRFQMASIDTGVDAAEQLERLNLNDPIFKGATVTITAKPSSEGGDGYVNVGYLNATGTALDKVKVDGDLAKIVAGNTQTKVGVKTLEVQSMGVYGTSTGAPDLSSVITGSLNTLKANGDLKRVNIQILNGGEIKTLTIAGSLIGGAAEYEGTVRVDGGIGKLTIKEDLLGGAAPATGMVIATSEIKSAVIGGDVVGGTAAGTGILSYAKKLTIHGNVVGQVETSGRVVGKTIDIKGSVLGGQFADADASGVVFVANGGTVKVGRDVQGGRGELSGVITTAGEDVVKSITIGGDLRGGSENYSGSIKVHAVSGTVKIKGDIRAGTGVWSGTVHAESLGKVLVDGSLAGGSDFLADPAGGIYAKLTIKEVTIKGSVEGTYGRSFIVAGGEIASDIKTIGKVNIGGNVSRLDILAGYQIDNNGDFDGYNGDASIGAVKVGGNWTASNITAGVETSDPSLGFRPDVTALIPGSSASLSSSIASIVIGGQAAGSPNSAVYHAFVAQQPGGVPSFKIGKKTYSFNSVNDQIPIGSTYYPILSDTDLFNFLAYMKA